LEISYVESFVSLCECRNISVRQAEFIVNSVRVYEFFGYEWYSPIWNSEIMGFWAKVSLKYRIKKDYMMSIFLKNHLRNLILGIKE